MTENIENPESRGGSPAPLLTAGDLNIWRPPVHVAIANQEFLRPEVQTNLGMFNRGEFEVWASHFNLLGNRDKGEIQAMFQAAGITLTHDGNKVSLQMGMQGRDQLSHRLEIGVRGGMRDLVVQTGNDLERGRSQVADLTGRRPNPQALGQLFLQRFQQRPETRGA